MKHTQYERVIVVGGNKNIHAITNRTKNYCKIGLKIVKISEKRDYMICVYFFACCSNIDVCRNRFASP